MFVVMSMEEYKETERKKEKMKDIRRLAKDILIEHSKDKSDWSKPSDMDETMTLDEAQLLLKRILE